MGEGDLCQHPSFVPVLASEHTWLPSLSVLQTLITAPLPFSPWSVIVSINFYLAFYVVAAKSLAVILMASFHTYSTSSLLCGMGTWHLGRFWTMVILPSAASCWASLGRWFRGVSEVSIERSSCCDLLGFPFSADSKVQNSIWKTCSSAWWHLSPWTQTSVWAIHLAPDGLLPVHVFWIWCMSTLYALGLHILSWEGLPLHSKLFSCLTQRWALRSPLVDTGLRVRGQCLSLLIVAPLRASLYH